MNLLTLTTLVAVVLRTSAISCNVSRRVFNDRTDQSRDVTVNDRKSAMTCKEGSDACYTAFSSLKFTKTVTGANGGTTSEQRVARARGCTTKDRCLNIFNLTGDFPQDKRCLIKKYVWRSWTFKTDGAHDICAVANKDVVLNDRTDRAKVDLYAVVKKYEATLGIGCCGRDNCNGDFVFNNRTCVKDVTFNRWHDDCYTCFDDFKQKIYKWLKCTPAGRAVASYIDNDKCVSPDGERDGRPDLRKDANQANRDIRIACRRRNTCPTAVRVLIAKLLGCACGKLKTLGPNAIRRYHNWLSTILKDRFRQFCPDIEIQCRADAGHHGKLQFRRRVRRAFRRLRLKLRYDAMDDAAKLKLRKAVSEATGVDCDTDTDSCTIGTTDTRVRTGDRRRLADDGKTVYVKTEVGGETPIETNEVVDPNVASQESCQTEQDVSLDPDTAVATNNDNGCEFGTDLETTTTGKPGGEEPTTTDAAFQLRSVIVLAFSIIFAVAVF